MKETGAEDSAKSMEEFQASELADDDEYQRLIKALEKSRENESRLMTKCRELNSEIVSTSTRVAAVLALAAEDESTIASLKKELDSACRLVDETHEKGKKDKETIRHLKEEIFHLQVLNEEQAGSTLQQEKNNLLKLNEELTQQRDELQATEESLKEKLKEACDVQEGTDARRLFAEETVTQLQQDLQVQQNEISREMRQKEKLDLEVKRLQASMKTKLNDIKLLQGHCQRSKEEQQSLEHQLKDIKMVNEKMAKDLEQVQVRSNKLQQDCDQLTELKDQLIHGNQEKTNELKIKEDEVTQMRHEINKQMKMREVIQKKFHLMEDQKAQMDVQRETLMALINGLEKDLEASRKQVGADKKAIYELMREKEILTKNMIKAAQSTEAEHRQVKLLEQDNKTLEREIVGYKQEAHRQIKIIELLKKDRDRYISDNSSLVTKIQQNVTEIQQRELEIVEWKTKLTEADAKFKQQSSLLESIVTERNLHRKSLTKAQEEVLITRNKMSVMEEKVAKLCIEMTKKDQALARDEQERKRLMNINGSLKRDLQSMTLQLTKTKQFVGSLRGMQQKLQNLITEADAEHINQKKELDQATVQRVCLAKHLQLRNEERTLLYEKIKIQESIISKGDHHYRNRMQEMHLLKLEIKRLLRKESNMEKVLPDIDDLRKALVLMQKEVVKARNKNRVLEEQLKSINIHRWRRLEGNDTGQFELIQKVQSLQKILIAKSQELEEHGVQLKEKEDLCLELKTSLAHLPGPEKAEQLVKVQRLLREKTTKLKVVTAEANVLTSKMNEYKQENQKLTDELQITKKQLFDLKKPHSENKPKTKMEQKECLPPLHITPLYMSGGFGITKPVRG